MRATVSIRGQAAYGKNDLARDIRPVISLVEVAYQVVHGFPGGVAAVAKIMGVSPNTLAHKINPNNPRHNLHPDELVAISRATGNHAILYAMATSLGEQCSPALPDQSGGSMVEAFWRWQDATAELACAVADPMHGGAAPTRQEARRVSVCVADLQCATAHVDAVMQALVPRPPTGVGGGS